MPHPAQPSEFLPKIVTVWRGQAIPAQSVVAPGTWGYDPAYKSVNGEFDPAKAKGLHQGVVVFKHALRNALMPLVTIAGLQFGNLVSGAVLVETVFSWPGLGTLALDAILGRDYPTLLGVLTFSSLFVITANLLTDLSYRWIDPRLRGR